MQQRLIDYELSWATGIRTHAAQFLTFRCGKLPKEPCWQPATPMPEPAVLGPDRDEALARHADLSNAFERACEAKDLEQAWETFQALAQAYHGSRAAVVGVSRKPAGVKWREPEPIQPREENPLLGVNRREIKRLRRIEALLAEWGPETEMGPRACAIREALMRAEGASSDWVGAMELACCRWHWEHLLDAAKLRARFAARVARQLRRDEWHRFCSESMAAGGG